MAMFQLHTYRAALWQQIQGINPELLRPLSTSQQGCKRFAAVQRVSMLALNVRRAARVPASVWYSNPGYTAPLASPGKKPSSLSPTTSNLLRAGQIQPSTLQVARLLYGNGEKGPTECQVRILSESKHSKHQHRGPDRTHRPEHSLQQPKRVAFETSNLLLF